MARAKTKKAPQRPQPPARKPNDPAGSEVERRWKEYWSRRKQLEVAVEKVQAAAAALKSAQSGNLLKVPVFMMGQSHAKAKRTLGEFKTNQRTNAFNKSDEEACHVAFLSALIALQKRAQAEGGNAVVDIWSITKNEELKSATQYRCAAGNFVANVVLWGTVAELPEKK